jgi:hypothetical protein
MKDIRDEEYYIGRVAMLQRCRLDGTPEDQSGEYIIVEQVDDVVYGISTLNPSLGSQLEAFNIDPTSVDPWTIVDRGFDANLIAEMILQWHVFYQANKEDAHNPNFGTNSLPGILRHLDRALIDAQQGEAEDDRILDLLAETADEMERAVDNLEDTIRGYFSRAVEPEILSPEDLKEDETRVDEVFRYLREGTFPPVTPCTDFILLTGPNAGRCSLSVQFLENAS